MIAAAPRNEETLTIWVITYPIYVVYLDMVMDLSAFILRLHISHVQIKR